MTIPQLPVGWATAKVGETGDYVNGFGFNQTTWGNSGLPIIRIQNLTDPSKPFNYVNTSIDPKYHIENGDILVSWSATLDSYLWNRGPAALNQHIFKVVPNERLVQRGFLYYLLRHTIRRMIDTEHLHGSTMKHINRGPFLAFDITIPPVPEQARIVEAIETQLSRLDAATAALERALANLKRYRAAVLNAACSGRLLSTPSDEWASRNWSDFRLGNLLQDGLQNGLYKHSSAYGVGMPILRIDDFQDASVKQRSLLRQLSVSQQEAETYGLAPNDLVINRVNSLPKLGKTLVVPPQLCPSVFESNMMRGRLVDYADAKFVGMYLQSSKGRKTLVANAKWAVNQASINQTDVKNVSLRLPPLAEQQRIVAEVERRLSVVERMDMEIAAGLKRAERLRQSILHKAFAGQLVPQDPNDEPAIALLDRIRAERANQTPINARQRAKGLTTRPLFE